MKKILFLAFLLASVTSFAQFSNYTNINGRYKWIAGKFDSTFTIPTGTTPSLRTGGANAPGAMFYRTTDSTIYQYTGTQWIKLRGGISPTDTAGLWITDLYRRNGTDSVFYVKGGSHTFAFRDSVGNAGGGGGGGKIYYFNGGVSMGTIGGLSMYELGDTANTGAAANFTRATTGNLANFITDPGKPGLLQIPAGVWTVDAYLSETGGGANHAQIWIEVEKWDGSTITTIATSPIEEITNGSVIDLYTWSVSIPTTSLAITDRIVIQFYISNTNGKTVTLYTQNGYVGEVHTTFTTGIGSLNGLTAPSQFFATGTSGTDFNIASATATHTFNLPTASATNRGALSTTDWTTFNNKIGGTGTPNYIAKFTGSSSIGNTVLYEDGFSLGLGTTAPSPIATGFRSVTINGTNRAYVTLQVTGVDLGYFYAVPSSRVELSSQTALPLVFSTNATERMRLDASGNLLIGTATLGDVLTVYRASGAAALFQNSTTGTGSSNGLYVGNALGLGYVWNYNNYALLFGTNNSERMRLDASGNLGLGISSPAAKLDVQATSGTLMRVENPSVAQLNIGNGGTSTNYYDADLQIFRSGNGTERMRLDASGNLGIGTSSPARKLDVNGTMRIADGSAIEWGGVTTAITGSSNTLLFYTNSAERMRLDASGNLAIGTTNTGYGNLGLYNSSNALFGIANSTSYAQLQQNGSDLYINVNLGGAAGGNTVFRRGSGATESMRLDASGNLGLGVTPSAWSAYTAMQITNGGALFAYPNPYEQIGLINNGYFNGSNWIYTNSTSAATRYLQYNGEHLFYTAPGGTAGNAISFTQAMTLDASGRLGIGTTSPSYKLDVYDAVNSAYLNVTGGGTTSMLFGSSSSGLGILGTTSNHELDIRTNNTSVIRVTTGGNLGIGTTSPTYKLEVNNAARVGNSSGGIILSGDGGSGNIWTDIASPLRLGANNAEYMRITSGGNVGIGTSSPSYKLDVNGAAKINNLLWFTPSSGLMALGANGTNLEFYNGAGAETRFTLTSGGDVGIGTTTPGTKLEVNGAIKTAAPSGGTAKPWKLGTVATVSPTSPDRTIEVEIDGVTYYIHAKTTNN